jgi:hypothetical protein
LLEDPKNAVFDEYGQRYTAKEFIAMVTEWDAAPKNTRTHYAHVRLPENSYWSTGSHADETWLDPEGFNFIGTEFS